MSISSETYLNPVYQNSFPDPFVFKFRGEYYAYCTDFWKDGKVFGVLKSRDLVDWTEIGGAMKPLAHNPPFYWAPEVVYSNGKFYLYYSVGNETLMEIRVAVSDTPEGNFEDCGKRLTFQDFAIDAHVFVDVNGQKYLFYATDFLAHSHIGTGTVVDKMKDFFSLEGNPRPVTRARFDWQIYDANRIEKGGVRWHTVEGAFILERKGVYYEMFSGGNWQNVSYGVSFATTDDIERDEEWKQFSDGEKTLPILRTIPGQVIGPGHNSVIRGLNNRETFCIYHRWTENGRVLAIDRMDFTGGKRIFIKGATTTSQPKPFKPKILDFFDSFDEANWKTDSGDWTVENNEIFSDTNGFSELLCQKQSQCFLLEANFRLIETQNGNFGVSFRNNAEEVIRIGFFPAESKIHVKIYGNADERTEEIPLPLDFDFSVFHLLQIEKDHFTVKIKLDDLVIGQIYSSKEAGQFSFYSENCRVAFSATALTAGFENLFEKNDLSLRGWKQISGADTFTIREKNLILTEKEGEKAIFQKALPFQNYELVVNVCFRETFSQQYKFGFILSVGDKKVTHTIWLEKLKSDWIMNIEDSEKIDYFLLPDSFSINAFHQFRFVKIENKMSISMEAEEIWTIGIAENAAHLNVFVQNASVALDMIRVTEL
ncbi:MAG: glycoside hydrolase family 43 protein [Pyrinomonadaceae bacterium]|nr:glycoside hydrolase family 43 protein [Pyrinomonadaceae bacterium]